MFQSLAVAWWDAVCGGSVVVVSRLQRLPRSLHLRRHHARASQPLAVHPTRSFGGHAPE